MTRPLTRFLALFLITLAPLVATAEPLPAPDGPVVLTVTGAITETNAEGAALFDLEMLRALGAAEIATDTIWTPRTHRFTGVRLSALLERVGATGTRLSATAINDYSVEIPVSDARADGPIVAYEMDGTVMSRRDKGPLWVIYPFSSSAAYRTEVIYARSIWQLDRMTVLD
ncbi:molybdopterin-dependent oxidoreductase [Tropicibacter sp. S64]|uniref:molybdopterin-dependent oxidoreductase n=1 Tax=Tropicibacter sp. S64 TaxID=3415122 RepID=UPI003C7EBA89